MLGGPELGKEEEEEEEGGSTRETSTHLEVMNMFIILILVIVSQVYTCVKTSNYVL